MPAVYLTMIKRLAIVLKKKEKQMPQTEQYLDPEIVDKINQYISANSDRAVPVTASLNPEELRAKLNLKIPDAGCSQEELHRFMDLYLKYAVRTGHSQFFNQLWSGFTLPGFLGDIITSLTNTSMYTYEVAPVATLLEKTLIQKMGSLAGFSDPEGIFMTGGSNGNLIAMMIARNITLPEIKQQGYVEGSNLVVFVSNQSHYSFEKAANILGIGSSQVLKVKSDNRGSLIPEELELKIEQSLAAGKKPFFVAATAGTTVLGAFDPCDRIAAIARKYNLWFHVDGSLGGTVLLSPQHRNLLKGIEMADSFVWNPHKLMGLPLTCSVMLLKEKGHLFRTNSTSGTEYIFHEDEFGTCDIGPFSLQCGRRVDALKLWLSWMYYGNQGYADRIDRFFELAAYMEEMVRQHSRLELMAPRTSINICFRYLPETNRNINDFNLRLRQKLAGAGICLVNYSYLGENLVLRPVIANHELTRSDIDLFFNNLHAAAEDLL